MNVVNLHPTLKKALEAPASSESLPVEKQTPEQARSEFDADIAAVDTAAPKMELTKEILIPNKNLPLKGRLYLPYYLNKNSELLIYFHGGGNIRGSINSHDSTCRVLANSGKILVLSVDYSLAPENPFPAAIDDAVETIKWVYENSRELEFDPSKLIVGGDSAGGNLAAAATIHFLENEGPKIAAQMLIYPVVDHVNTYNSTNLYSKGFMLDSMPFYTESYLPNKNLRSDPMASPIFAKRLQGLPPAFILSCGFDPLHDQNIEYAEKLKAAGVTVDHVNYPNMIHGFTLLRSLLPEADQALTDAILRTKKLVGL